MAYEGNFVAITRSIARPSASLRSSRRQRNACERTRSPGYHLYGTVTSSAWCSRSHSSETRSSAKISAPPRVNGTCGAQTAILTECPLDVHVRVPGAHRAHPPTRYDADRDVSVTRMKTLCDYASAAVRATSA